MISPSDLTAKARIEELLAQADDAGVTPALFPGTTTLARTIEAGGLGQEAYTFRYLNGIAEGVPWAAVLGDQREFVTANGPSQGVVRVRTRADPLMTWYATLTAVRLFKAAIECLEDYTRGS